MINCDNITKGTKDLMLSLIDKSDDENREHYIKLCEDINGNITSSNVCVGKECEIPLKGIAKTQCPINTKTIGDFHTHPWFEGIEKEPLGGLIPTEQDIVGTVSDGYSSFCHGHSDIQSPVKVNSKWMERKTNTVDCYDIKDKELLEFGREAQQLAQKGNTRQAIKKIIPLMFKRTEKLGYPFSKGAVLDTKCKLTKITDRELK